MANQLRLKQFAKDSTFTFDAPGYQIKNMLDPTAAQDAATKSYVDNVAAGLNVHPAVKVATTTAGTFPTDFQAGDTIDGIVLAIGDRLLIKNQGNPVQNGIYEITTSGPVRAQDADGTPSNEVSSGDLVFVTNGTQNSGSSWILLGDGIQVPDTDPLNWTQFASATAYTGSTGITLSGNDFQLDFTSLTTQTIDVADTIAFYDATGTAMAKSTITDFINNLDIVRATGGNGIITKTANDTYASRTLTGTTDRITITNGDGVSGNPTFDIASTYTGQTSITTLGIIATGTWNATTIGVAYGGTGLTSYTAGDIIYANGTTSLTTLAAGTSSQVLIGGASPSWGSVDLTSMVSGTLPNANGGTGQSTYATGDILYASAPNTLSKLAAGTNGYVLTLVGGVPGWAIPAGDITDITAGTGLSGGGTSGSITLNVNVDGTSIIVNTADQLEVVQSAIVTAGSGTTLNGTNVDWTGTLDKNATIAGAGFDISLGTSGSNASNLYGYATGTVDFSSNDISAVTRLTANSTNAIISYFNTSDMTTSIAANSSSVVSTYANTSTNVTNTITVNSSNIILDLDDPNNGFANTITLDFDRATFDSGIKIGNITATPSAGDIRWTGSDYEGYMGGQWVSFTSGAGLIAGQAINIATDSSVNVLYDGVTISVNGNGDLYVIESALTIATSQITNFAADVSSEIFDAGNFVNGTTIGFTVTAGASVTAEVIDGTIGEVKLDVTNTPSTGDYLTSAGGGQFVWVAPVDVINQYENSAVSEAASSTIEVKVATNIFPTGATPSANRIPMVFINGQKMKLGDGTNSTGVYFGDASGVDNAGTAYNFNAIPNDANLWFDPTTVGWAIDTTDVVEIIWESIY